MNTTGRDSNQKPSFDNDSAKNANTKIFNKTKNRTKDSLNAKNNWLNKTVGTTKNKVRKNVGDRVNLEKEKFSKSNISKFAKSEGLAGKAKFLAGSIINKSKGYEAFKKAEQFAKKALNVIKFIISNIKVIAISSLIIIIVWNVTIEGISLYQAASNSPHYYCDLEADEGIKRSRLFKQYCVNMGNGFTLDNINGHYIMQDGSGPCTDCALANLLLRYYSAKEINFYDYLWDDTGFYRSDNGANSLATSIGNSSIRGYITTSGTTTCKVARSTKKLFGSSYNFTKRSTNPNGCNPDHANWGYVRDESVNFDGQANPYQSLENNENWVWDLSATTTWTAKWTNGNSITINGETATWVYNAGSYGNGDDLKKLLDDHPSGVVVYRDYGTNSHAILVTGYDVNGFKVVDSGLGLAGGFEGYASSSLFCIQGCWSESILNNPVGVKCYVYLEEDQNL